MTTYSHTITLDDSQRIAFEKMLTLMIEHCDAQMQAGENIPYEHHKMICQEIWSKVMRSKPQMMSTSSSCWPEGRTP